MCLDVGASVMLAPSVWENDICSQQTHSMSYKYTKNAFTAEPWPQLHLRCIYSPEYVCGGCKCRPISIIQNL